MTGWAVNSIAKAVEGSIPFSPNIIINNYYILMFNIIKFSPYSSMAERNTVNIFIDVRFILGAKAKDI